MTGRSSRRVDLAVPVGLVGVSLVALVEGIRLIAGASSAHQSRPPGVFLCLVAAVLAMSTVLATRTSGAAEPDTGDEAAPGPAEASKTGSRGAVWKAVGLMAVFAWALPWIGFALTTGGFLVVYLMWVPRYPVWKAVLYGVAIDAAAVLLFGQAGVVLPTGAYGF